jgi:hypothetical protein
VTCQEFADTFNVYIGFDQSGYGQIFAEKPKLIERDIFFLSKDDAKLLSCLVDDFYEWSNKRRTVLFSPGTKPEMKDQGKIIMECNDFKKDDAFAANVLVREVFTMPDPINDGEKYIVTCRDDAGHDLIWTTKAKTIPNQNDRKFLKAKIVGNTASTEYGVPAFAITNCSFTREKK